MVPFRGASSTLALALALLFVGPALLPADAQEPAPAANGTLLLSDPIGDAGPLGIGVEGNPAMAAYQHIDIVAFEVGPDDADNLHMRLEVAGFDPTLTAPAQALALTDLSCTIRWTYEDPPSGTNYHYELDFSSSNLARTPGGAPEITSNNMMRYYDSPEGFRWNWEFDLPVEITLDTDRASFLITLPKQLAPVWPAGAPAQRGDTLLVQLVRCASDLALYGNVADTLTAPAGSAYKMQAAGQGQVVQVRFADQAESNHETDAVSWTFPRDAAATPISTVAPGVATILPMVLHNQADAKKLVRLGVTGAPEDWNVTIVSSLFLAAGETRTVNLIVTPAEGAATGTEHRIDVTAEVVGHDEHGTAGRILKIAPQLSPTTNTFHVHIEPWESQDPLSTAVYTAVPQYQVTASLLEQVEGFDNDPAPVAPATYWGGGSYLDPVGRPVRLDTETPATIQVAFSGDPSRTIVVRMSLSSDENGAIFNVNEEVPGDGVATFEVPILGEDLTLAPGTQMYFYMSVGPSEIGASSTSAVSLDPSQTWFRLPVVDEAQDVVITDGRYLPTLALAPNEDRTTYINPGKEYAFDLVLANEGVETDDLRVVVNATNATGWDIDIEPGSLFRVSPGNSTPVSVVVRAPADAAEGAHPRFDVIAQSKHDKVARTTIRLDAIVTTGVDIAAKSYAAKDNELSPLAEDTEESPAPTLLVVLVGLALAAGVLRRRQVA